MKPLFPPTLLPEHINAFPALSLLREHLTACSAVALAYSGGLDSRFLAHVAPALVNEGVRLHLFHITGPHVPKEDTRAAVLQAEEKKLPLTLVPLNPLDIAAVRANREDRCYHCKRYLFSSLALAAAKHPAFSGLKPVLCDGTNADDLAAYRPGLAALKELGVRSPLAESGIGKKDIRAAGALIGFENPEQKARPCLLTRFAYHLEPDEGCLEAVQAAEADIAWILNKFAATLPDFRLRLSPPPAKALTNGSSAFPHRVEVHIAAEISPKMKQQVRNAVVLAGFMPPAIACMESVHGWFDRNRA